MAVTFLQCVNATLRRVGEIAGDSQALATSTVTSTATGLTATDAFTDSRRQHKIDIIIQLWNEAQHQMYALNLAARVASTATMTLVADQREYDLPDDFERIAGEHHETRAIRGATTGLVVYEYPGGYAQLLVDRPTATDYTGDPDYWCISPVAAKIVLASYPTSDIAGHTYHYLYEKRLALTSTMATSTLPFSDTVADALVPVVAESYNRVMKKDFDEGFLTGAMTRSLEFLQQKPRRARYGQRRGR